MTLLQHLHHVTRSPATPDGHLALALHSAFDIWQEIFTNEILEMITNQTSLYANRDNNQPAFQVGYMYKRWLNFWANCSFLVTIVNQRKTTIGPHKILGVPVVSKTMSQTRFYTMKKYFQIEDNQNLQEGNKMAELSTLNKHLNDSLTKFGIFLF